MVSIHNAECFDNYLVKGVDYVVVFVFDIHGSLLAVSKKYKTVRMTNLQRKTLFVRLLH